ncbi:MAG: ATP-binding cassette domain-containing protein [Lachnospiraceae bacterium]|nr:ATP-binding cassette domain-containing protein [Lachnospiraceae bacterium]
MSNNTDRKVLLSLKNVDVKFNVRGRVLQAIRNVSLDIYENESLAIVGESGSGKSVLTKTFAGMLDSNGYVSNGSIVLADDEISKTDVKLTSRNKLIVKRINRRLNKLSALERGAEEYNKIQELKNALKHVNSLSEDEEAEFAAKEKKLKDSIIDANNYLMTLDKKLEEDVPEIAKTKDKIEGLEKELKELLDKKAQLLKEKKEAFKADTAKREKIKKEIADLESLRKEKIAKKENDANEFGLSEETLKRNQTIAYEVLLSIGRYPLKDQVKFVFAIENAFKRAMRMGVDLTKAENLNKVFETVAFRVEFRSLDEENQMVHGYAIIDCAKIKYTRDWQQIRGCRIATVFQDPMTSLNPVLTIGKQIMTVIMKHQKCSQVEAKKRTIDIMGKVGILDPERRFNDYPFEYSGGMRQRIVIAIALSCQPKILICDEPTTALDVTIQAQIIRLIKDLQHDLGFTTVYITHDLGVVANVAERVAVIYGGQIVEVGTVEEIFYEPRHPYTWALLSSLPQLAERGTELFSINGTPPSLYNKIVGDAFAPRNKYAMAIDLVKEPPVFKISDTHYAKTWLLDPRAPKVEIPEGIRNLHEKMLKSYINVSE